MKMTSGASGWLLVLILPSTGVNQILPIHIIKVAVGTSDQEAYRVFVFLRFLSIAPAPAFRASIAPPVNNVEFLMLDAKVPVRKFACGIVEVFPVSRIWNLENSIAVQQSALQTNVTNGEKLHVNRALVNAAQDFADPHENMRTAGRFYQRSRTESRDVL
jgi:hypothetical protein